jgi:riboflavin kinase/FMN adenylyltransferase
VESHLLGFDENVTGGRMELRFLQRIRDEQKFSGVDALRAQIALDIETARKYFAERNVAHSSPQS